MGAQIAAHCVNAKVPVILFDLPAATGDKNAVVVKAIEGLKKVSANLTSLNENMQGIVKTASAVQQQPISQ